MDVTSPQWQKSSFCGSNACVEVARMDEGVAMRDSKDSVGPVLTFTLSEWNAFVAGVIAGDFAY